MDSNKLDGSWFFFYSLIFFFVLSLGQQFAYIQAITVTSMLLQKFDFELVNPHNEPAYGTSLTLPMANGLPVRITRRRDDPFRREE